MKLPMGKQELELGGPYLGTLKDSTDILDDPVAQRERMTEDGYLLFRRLHSPERVRTVRDMILTKLERKRPDRP